MTRNDPATIAPAASAAQLLEFEATYIDQPVGKREAAVRETFRVRLVRHEQRILWMLRNNLQEALELNPQLTNRLLDRADEALARATRTYDNPKNRSTTP